MKHDIASVVVGPHRVTVICDCGKPISHPTEEGARRRHYIHERVAVTGATVDRARDVR